MNSSLSTFVCMILMLFFIKEGISETIEDYICSHKFKGCRVNYGTRSCTESEASGCTNPFPYLSRNECEQDFHGNSNICELYKPCLNNGICSPITTDDQKRTFKCECSSTGFFGERCEISCPISLRAKDMRMFPCIPI